MNTDTLSSVYYAGDVGSKIKTMADTLIESGDFPVIQNLLLNIRFSWRNKPRHDAFDRAEIVRVQRLGDKEFDLHGYHFDIEICRDLWEMHSEEAQVRSLWAALHSIDVKQNDEGYEQDAIGRYKCTVNSPDVVLTGFVAEFEKFGVDAEDIATISDIKQFIKP